MTNRALWVIGIATLPAVELMARAAVAQAISDPSALFDRRPAVREEAVRTLGARGEVVVPDLLRALFDADRNVRSAAIEALKDVGGDRALEALAAAVHDRDARVRENVVYAAVRLGGPRAETVVELLLADPVDTVREAAQLALIDLRSSGGTAVRSRPARRRSGAASTTVP